MRRVPVNRLFSPGYDNLEIRALLAVDLDFVKAGGLKDLTLTLNNGNFQLVNNVNPSIIYDSALANDNVIQVTGTATSDILRLDTSKISGNVSIIFVGEGVDTISIQADSDFAALNSVINVGSVAYTYGGFENLELSGGASANSFTLSTIPIGLSLKVEGAGGDDAVTIDGALNLNHIEINAETISVNNTLSATDGVNLVAAGKSRAVIQINNSISSAGPVIIAAKSGETTSKSTFGSFDFNSTATIDVSGEGVKITGSSVSLSAHNTANVTASLISGSLGTLKIGQTNTTRVSINGGASVEATGESGLVDIEAIDGSMIKVSVNSTEKDTFDFGTLVADANVSRNTSVSFGGSGELTAKGGVKVNARNEGEITTETISELVGSSLTTANDTVTANVTGAIGSGLVRPSLVEVTATNAASYNATGKTAKNVISGGTSASIHGAVTYASVAIRVAANDIAKATARSTPVSIDLSLLGANVTLGLSVASNEFNRETQAGIRNATLETSGGDIEILASANRRISAEAESTKVSKAGSAPVGVGVSLGGILVENRLLGDVRAIVEAASKLKTTNSGDVLVSAKDSSAVNASSQLSAQAETDGVLFAGIGVTGGVSIALNMVGWKASESFLALFCSRRDTCCFGRH